MKHVILAAVLTALILCGCTQTIPSPSTPSTVPTTEAPQTTTTEPTAPTIPKPEAQAVEILSASVRGRNIAATLSDSSYLTQAWIFAGESLVISGETPFAALYIQWEQLPQAYTLTWDGGSLDNSGSFLHEYIRLPQQVTEIALSSPTGEHLPVCGIRLFTQGSTPADVQDWLAPCREADILVFPTHADDDVLIFGAVMSYYAIEKGLTIQTAFPVFHPGEPERKHEQLDGLWALGIRHYPVVGNIPDLMSRSLAEAKVLHQNDDLLYWQVSQIRRFRPLVILGHDIGGEYGHGQHRLNTHFLLQAVEAAADSAQYPELGAPWNTPKVYLHLYPERQIVFDVNAPLQNDPDGRTPFQIAEDAYALHVSQHKYYFQVTQGESDPMDCRVFGLWRSTVGSDTAWDLMENIDPGNFRR